MAARTSRDLPASAARFARTWIDDSGRPQVSFYDVPVDDLDRRTDHIRHACHSKATVEDDDGKKVTEQCDHVEWLEPDEKPGYCPAHGTQLVREGDARRSEPLLPWDEVWADLRPLVGYPAAAAGAVGALAFGADVAAVPAYLPALATVPAAAGAWWATRRHLTRRAVEDGKLDPEAETVGARQRSKIGRRARTAGYCAAGAMCWLGGATTLGLDPATTSGAVSWLSLAAAAAIGSYPWRRHILSQRAIPELDLDTEIDLGLDLTLDQVAAEAMQIWEDRVDQPTGALPGTSLTDFVRIKGGWRAAIVPDVPGAIDPERFSQAHTARRIAGAYRAALADVTIEINPEDVSSATISMQRRNPLHETRVWPGPAETCDWDKGLQRVGWYADDSPAWYRWWNDGGPWHDLISGCTGSGKSEFVESLLLAELHSGGLILSRVIDPQAGQSFGELQDHVDWFAPCIAEAQLLLLDTVKQMRRRNRVYSRRRQKTWKATREFPLISVTIDEAHEVLRDPICLALVEKLAKMARKCGIKLRIITQVPTVTEIGNSTPIKDALLAGQIVMFRTGSPLSALVALNGNLEVDPHKLPPTWPKGSLAEGELTAGVGYLVGVERRNMALRMFFTGAEEDLPRWLYDEDGEPSITPGQMSEEAVAESGPLWRQRHERVTAFFESPPDDGDILPGDLVALLTARAAGESMDALQNLPAATDPVPAPDRTAKAQVLKAAVQHADAAGRVDKKTLAKHARAADGKEFADRTLSQAVTDLIDDRMLVRVKNGLYDVTDLARGAVRAEAEQAVAAMLGDGVDSEEELANADA